MLLSTYTVNSAADVAASAGNYFGTLRWAVAQANAANAPTSSPSVINFNSSLFGANGTTVVLSYALLIGVMYRGGVRHEAASDLKRRPLAWEFFVAQASSPVFCAQKHSR